MITRLGLDVGSTSVGWCLLELNEDREPVSILKTGSRIFSDGRDRQSHTSLKAGRRLARQARRGRDRFVQRQKKLMNHLIKHGFMPADADERKKIELLDPYECRANAVNQECTAFEMGRALFHLNQRRGFKSNRKTADSDTGVVKQSISKLKEELAKTSAKTLGEYLFQRRQEGSTVRARRQGTKSDDLYDLYPSRELYEEEFHAIWDKQAGYDPDLYSDDRRDIFHHIIFHQRKLKPVEPGKCSYLPEEDRSPKALPSVQRFRILQELNNLKWIDHWQRSHPVYSKKPLWDHVLSDLDKKKTVTFTSIANAMKKLGIVEYDVGFNLHTDKRNHLKGNDVAVEMRKPDKVGDAWDEWDLRKQDEFIMLLLDDQLEDDEVSERLTNEYGIPTDHHDAIMAVKLADGYGHVSKEAIYKILPVMEDQGLQLYDAVKEAGLDNSDQYDPNKPLADKLEYYGKVLVGDVLPGTGKPTDNREDRYGAIPNPTVHIALNQIRRVVNELISKYGKPEQIVIEVARDLPLGADGKKELIGKQSQNQKENDRIRQELAQINVEDNRRNRQKFQLWEELSSKPTNRCCVFTGRMISMTDLFSPQIEIEHLLPFSRTLDDSMANKTVCFSDANRYKNNRTPFEAFGQSSDGYQWADILDRAQQYLKKKQWRFSEDAMDKFDDNGGFLERHLNDTRYIARYTRKYLSSVVDSRNIWVVTGRLTSLLRGKWGLNSILRGDNAPEEEQNKKLRDDHRHHAIDAVVIAMTSRSLVQFVSTAAGRGETMDTEHLFSKRDDIDPWPNFRQDVQDQMESLVVSHRASKKDQGQLHNETAYGFDKEDPSLAVHRIPVESIVKAETLNKIRDNDIRNDLLNETIGLDGKDFKEAVLNWCKKRNIRRLRIQEKITLIPIRDKKGDIYKGYKGDGNAYIDIYSDAKGKWQGEVVSTFNANQHGFSPEWKMNKDNNAVMRLRINDVVEMDHLDQRIFVRVQKMTDGQITLAPINEANVDARYRDKTDLFKFVFKSPSRLQKAHAVKVHISPTGLISR